MRRLLIALLLVLPAVARATPSFEVIGSYQPAASQPTVAGMRIRSLHAFENKIYLAYGDGTGNTGPITVGYYDPAAGDFTSVFSAATEVILKYSTVGSRLIAPYGDPRNDWQSLEGRYAIGSSADAWRNAGGFSAIHVYEAIEGPDGSLFMSGSALDQQCNPETGCGRIWRSRDGGQTWSVSFHEELASPVTYRCSGLAVYRGQVYAGCTTGYWTMIADDVWRPVVMDTSLRKQKNPLGPASTLLTHAREIDDRLVYSDVWLSEPFGTGVWAYDGTLSTQIYSGSVYDVAYSGHKVFVLTPDGIIERIGDVSAPTPEEIATAPQDASSIEVLGDDIYVGTASSSLVVCRGCARV